MPTSAALTVRTGRRPGASDRPSEDRIYTTPNAVIVLDGATQSQPLQRTGGWIADQLGQHLTHGLTLDPATDLPELLEHAIAAIVTEHALTPDTAPSTTVSIIRWNDLHLDVLVLCDSPVVVLDTTGQIHQVRDDRLADVASRIRPRGSTRHLSATERAKLTTAFEAQRNQPNGFWCVTATPEAAHHALTRRFRTNSVQAVLAMTDGVSAGIDHYGTPPDWETAIAIALNNPQQLVDQVHTTELADPDCTRWSRTKTHDDKAAAIITS